jgi:hypothetical protein
MDRRQLLATLATGIGGVAGCLTETPGESMLPAGNGTTDEPATGPGSTGQPEANTDTVSEIVVRKAVRYESFLGSGGVLAADGRQYVVASLEGKNGQLDDEYVFEASGQTWEADLSTTGGRTRSVADREWPVIGFDLPSPLSASTPRIRSEDSGERWTLGDDASTVLSEPGPRYELNGLTAPETVSQGEPMTVELSVTNVSETDGRFLAAVYWPTERIADDDESHVIERTVAAGDTVSATLDIGTSATVNETKAVTLSVEGHISTSRDVRVEVPDTVV